MNWNDVVAEYIADQKELDPSFAYSLQGNGSQSNPWQISCGMDLAYLSYRYAQNSSNLNGKHMILTDDIVLNDGYFDKDGAYHDGGDGKLFKFQKLRLTASFDGKGHTIYGLYGQLFDWVTGASAIFKNCTIKSFFAKDYGEAIIYHLSDKAKVECVSVHGIFLNQEGCAFIRLVHEGCVVSRCNSYVDVYYRNSSNSWNVNGMFGTIDGTVENCHNYGNVLGNSYAIYVAGLCGGGSGKIINCTNHGKVTGSRTAGICFGGSVAIVDCTNYGVAASAIVHQGSGNLIVNCKNFGKCNYMVSNSGVKVLNCENYAKNTGICQRVTSGDLIRNCVNHAEISTANKGAICTTATGNAVIEGCKNEGDITGQNSSGIVYSATSDVVIRNCLNVGNLTYSNSQGILKTGTANLQGCISASKRNGVDYKIYYGDNFSAFFVKWKTGYIGLKALESAGVYMFAIPNEEYLRQIGYTKAG